MPSYNNKDIVWMKVTATFIGVLSSFVMYSDSGPVLNSDASFPYQGDDFITVLNTVYDLPETGVVDNVPVTDVSDVIWLEFNQPTAHNSPMMETRRGAIFSQFRNFGVASLGTTFMKAGFFAEADSRLYIPAHLFTAVNNDVEIASKPMYFHCPNPSVFNTPRCGLPNTSPHSPVSGPTSTCSFPAKVYCEPPPSPPPLSPPSPPLPPLPPLPPPPPSPPVVCTATEAYSRCEGNTAYVEVTKTDNVACIQLAEDIQFCIGVDVGVGENTTCLLHFSVKDFFSEESLRSHVASNPEAFIEKVVFTSKTGTSIVGANLHDGYTCYVCSTNSHYPLTLGTTKYYTDAKAHTGKYFSTASTVDTHGSSMQTVENTYVDSQKGTVIKSHTSTPSYSVHPYRGFYQGDFDCARTYELVCDTAQWRGDCSLAGDYHFNGYTRSIAKTVHDNLPFEHHRKDGLPIYKKAGANVFLYALYPDQEITDLDSCYDQNRVAPLTASDCNGQQSLWMFCMETCKIKTGQIPYIWVLSNLNEPVWDINKLSNFCYGSAQQNDYYCAFKSVLVGGPNYQECPPNNGYLYGYEHNAPWCQGSLSECGDKYFNYWTRAKDDAGNHYEGHPDSVPLMVDYRPNGWKGTHYEWVSPFHVRTLPYHQDILPNRVVSNSQACRYVRRKQWRLPNSNLFNYWFDELLNYCRGDDCYMSLHFNGYQEPELYHGDVHPFDIFPECPGAAFQCEPGAGRYFNDVPNKASEMMGCPSEVANGIYTTQEACYNTCTQSPACTAISYNENTNICKFQVRDPSHRNALGEISDRGINAYFDNTDTIEAPGFTTYVLPYRQMRYDDVQSDIYENWEYGMKILYAGCFKTTFDNVDICVSTSWMGEWVPQAFKSHYSSQWTSFEARKFWGEGGKAECASRYNNGNNVEELPSDLYVDHAYKYECNLYNPSHQCMKPSEDDVSEGNHVYQPYCSSMMNGVHQSIDYSCEQLIAKSTTENALGLKCTILCTQKGFRYAYYKEYQTTRCICHSSLVGNPVLDSESGTCKESKVFTYNILLD
jgi:hypothetical protein